MAGSSDSLSSFDSAPFSASVASLVLPSFGCSFCGGSNRIVSFLFVPALVFTSADRFIRFSFPGQVSEVKDAGWICEIVCPGTRIRSMFNESVTIGLALASEVGIVTSGWAVMV